MLKYTQHLDEIDAETPHITAFFCHGNDGTGHIHYIDLDPFETFQCDRGISILLEVRVSDLERSFTFVLFFKGLLKVYCKYSSNTIYGGD